MPNDGVNFETDGRIHCCPSYGLLQGTGNEVLAHNPGVLCQVIFELITAPNQSRSVHGQRYCLEEHVSITAMYVHLISPLRLFDSGYVGQYKVSPQWFEDFPSVKDHMDSPAFAEAVEANAAALLSFGL